MGDRGGGRENKKGSLRLSTKNPGCAAAKKGSAKETKEWDLSTVSDPIPPPSAQGLYVDANACLLNRQFDKDLERVLQRSRNAKIEAIVVPCMDVERTQARRTKDVMSLG
eukprot:1024116-Pyramimonas_sp.AAC.1